MYNEYKDKYNNNLFLKANIIIHILTDSVIK